MFQPRRRLSRGVAARSRPLSGRAGQAVVILAIMVTILFGAVGIAVDAAIGYRVGLAAQGPAAAAAVSAVVFMPNQFNAPPGNDAVDRALTISQKNGFDISDVADGVIVDSERVPIPGSSPVAYYDNKLQVTVSRNVPTTFMQLFGFRTYQVSRTAIATYQPPISLGQPGGQIGSATSDLGTGGNPNNNCDNLKGWKQCSPGGSYYLHEEDAVNFSDKTTFAAMRYTLSQVNNVFIRSNDVKLTQMTVLPIDATNWKASPPIYTNVNTGLPITQLYSGLNPVNMAIYHNWINIANYPILPTDGGLSATRLD